jgi:PhzF family phenazine biosynthesis protein
MPLPYYVADAFVADAPFTGNPAGVCLMEAWPEASRMQRAAAENNLSETAFIVPRGGEHEIRWFTPAIEVDLCGHATWCWCCFRRRRWPA